MISFDLTEEQRQIRSTVRAFVERELIPREPELQARELAGGPGWLTRQETRALRALARSHGLWGVDTPEEFGGAGLDHVTRGLINEELGRTIAWFSFGGSVPAILYRADDYQREHYLLPALADDLLACFALSEPEAGSDARALRTRARRDGADWIIDGGKTWITNGNEADFAVVFARTQADGGEQGISALLVDREMGWTSYPIAVMGAQSCARLEFERGPGAREEPARPAQLRIAPGHGHDQRQPRHRAAAAQCGGEPADARDGRRLRAQPHDVRQADCRT